MAILGGFTRKGEWVVPKHFTGFLFMGGAEIDLRDPRFEDREVNINIIAIMGGCEITVPEDANVRVTGVGIMGAFEHSTPEGVAPTARLSRSRAWLSWAASTLGASRRSRPTGRRDSGELTRGATIARKARSPPWQAGTRLTPRCAACRGSSTCGFRWDPLGAEHGLPEYAAAVLGDSALIF